MLLYQVNYDYLPYIRALVLPMTGEHPGSYERTGYQRRVLLLERLLASFHFFHFPDVKYPEEGGQGRDDCREDEER